MDAENLSGLQVGGADTSDWAALTKIDSVAAAGDQGRRAGIRRWCEHSVVLMTQDASGPLGYSVLEYSFFEQGFVTMLMVAPSARRRGVGAHLLTATETACTTAKLFTSANVSNHPMQHLLQRAGRCPVGLLTASTSDRPGTHSPETHGASHTRTTRAASNAEANAGRSHAHSKGTSGPATHGPTLL
nr:GNAT family N-acetyltransferase [Streptomyces adelaidensis]